MPPSLRNPFAHVERADDADLIALAKTGDLSSLDGLLRKHQTWIFNLALRMVWRREVAEDATQEILLKAITHLGGFEGRSKFSTWLYRIAVNHLLNMRKSEREDQHMSFADMGRSLDGCEETELPDESMLPVSHGLLVEEAKLACVTAMLTCLDRRQRLAFLLGEVFGVTSEFGAEVMDISRENFRQLLGRARSDLYQFMHDKCGLVNPLNPCRCSKKAGAFMRRGWLDAGKRQFTRDRIATVRDVAPGQLDELEELQRAYAEIYRDTPMSGPPDIVGRLRSIIDSASLNRD
jgi:RNA polymerase sigma factor (sigma-70 family)